MFLNHFVAGTGRDVVAIGPHRRSRVIGKQCALKSVAIICAQRIITHAYGVAHRKSSVWLAFGFGPGEYVLPGKRIRGRRWRIRWQNCGRARIRSLARMYRVTMPFWVLSWIDASEDWHHKKPPPCQLVITNYSITIVAGLACSAKTSPESI